SGRETSGMADATLPDNSPHVIKVGGRLLDLPDLPARLDRWLAAQGGAKPMLVVGGGALADVVRDWDQRHGRSESKAHWIAIDAMGINTRLLTASLPGAVDVSRPEGAIATWADGGRAVMQPKAWLLADQSKGMVIPHRWSFTSDSIAAWLAHRLHAPRLTLLKSSLPAGGASTVTIAEATAAGMVDGDFAQAARGVACVRLVNLRDDAWA